MISHKSELAHFLPLAVYLHVICTGMKCVCVCVCVCVFDQPLFCRLPVWISVTPFTCKTSTKQARNNISMNESIKQSINKYHTTYSLVVFICRGVQGVACCSTSINPNNNTLLLVKGGVLGCSGTLLFFRSVLL